MSTSQPASSVPESSLEKEERVHPFRVFNKQERLIALICALLSLVVYWSTTMPNIGLNDDGEMATAALHFGVMHPSGYPLWTILAGLFSHLIPFGNGSWKINLFSGLCTSTAVGIFSLIALNATRWIGVKKLPAIILSVASTLTFAWVTPVWSHAVVGKGLYALHVCLMMTLLMLCYVWIRRPYWKNAFVWVVFIFALGMSNHHTTLALAFLPLLVILLLHAELFWEYAVYSLIIASALYLGFAYISTDQYHAASMKAAVRLSYTVWIAFIFLILLQRKLTQWRQGLLLVVAVVVGLLPYAYMPLASSTNPPMNWSYTSTPEGFFYAINRSQYWGTLADQLQGTVGKLMGVPPAEKPKGPKSPDEETAMQSFMGFCKVYWKVMAQNFSPIPILLVLLTFALFWRLPREQRIWFYLLVIAFCLSAFLQPLSWNNGYDNAGWDMQYQYVSLGYAFFIMLACFGGAVLYTKLDESLPRAKWLGWGVVALMAGTSIYTFVVSLPQSSQRGHWFGWMYGHDMLADLPKDSFVFGGTDPGRFVPTYMVFGESFEKYKRDPNFDRRDLYIVTQNALADTFYNRYIRSHYTTERPTEFNWVEKLLGRDHTYPKEYLVLPHREEIMELFEGLMRKYQENPATTPNPQSDPVALNSAVGEWIFLHNRDKADGTPRHFFVEESFPMPWSYPYAVPHGLCYEIQHDPLPALPPGTAEKDIAWWDDYIKNHLEATPGFENDELAHHSFAKLRNTGGNIYMFRNMGADAEKAYRQALYLWPANTETTGNLVNLLTAEGRFKDARDLIAESLPIDPNSKPLQHLQVITEARLKAFQDLPSQLAALQANPGNRQLLSPVIQSLLILGRQAELDAIISNAIAESPTDVAFLRDMINFYASQQRIPKALEVALVLQKAQPNQWDVPYTICKYQFITGQREAGYASLHQAVLLGGNAALQQISRETMFQQLAADPAFQQAIQVNPTQTDASAPSADAVQLKNILETAPSNPPAASKQKQ
jgi:tetratricopeptide (TPR) repeat protein